MFKFIDVKFTKFELRIEKNSILQRAKNKFLL